MEYNIKRKKGCSFFIWAVFFYMKTEKYKSILGEVFVMIIRRSKNINIVI